MNILFVCTGNTCRSPMAEHLFRKMLLDAGRADVQVASAGVSPAPWLSLPTEAWKALAKEGVEKAHHAPRGLDKKLLAKSDLILVMEDYHREAIVGRFPEASGKIQLLDTKGVRDPFGKSPDVYDATLAQIKQALTNLLDSFQRRL